jgi:hypothetical protein
MGIIAEKAVPLLNALSRSDREMLVVAIAVERSGGSHNPAEVTLTSMENMGFPCRQLTLRQGGESFDGDEHSGLLMVWTASFPNADMVVLYAKAGRNLDNRERANIREIYADECRRRAVRGNG